MSQLDISSVAPSACASQAALLAGESSSAPEYRRVLLLNPLMSSLSKSVPSGALHDAPKIFPAWSVPSWWPHFWQSQEAFSISGPDFGLFSSSSDSVQHSGATIAVMPLPASLLRSNMVA